MIKVIIFDADGVLLTGERFSLSLAREYGISEEKTRSFFTGPFKDCLVGKADLKEVISPYLSEWGWTKGLDAIIDYWFEAYQIVNKELVQYIQKLRSKGILCFIATDNEKYRFAHMLDKFGFSKSFDKAYASAHMGHKKINQIFFLKIFNELENIDKKEVLFFDDDIENIKCAEDFGIKAELYTSFGDFEQKMKKYI
jgi:putative hydrolase of the HAD superfamily